MPVELRVLGEIEVRVEGQLVPLGHARQQCVLAALAVDAGQPVRVDTLIERVWGTRTPGDARNVLYSYVARLRAALAGGGDEVAIGRRSGGYVLTIDPLAIDLYRFRQLVSAATASADPHEATAGFATAMALWRGDPFAGLVNEWLDTVRLTLAQERFAAELAYTDLRLRGDEHVRLLPELTTRAAAHPLDERAAGQLMLALYRAGRPADALRQYQQMRQRLVTELGVDPGPELRSLHERMLAADPSLTGLPAGRTAVPRQLPAPPGQFAGRESDLARLSAAASARDRMAIIAISGAGGVGKTWLALHWAHQQAGRFPDGQLHVNLRGFDPTGQPTPAGLALRGFLDALGVSPTARPAGLAEQASLFRSLVADRRMLIVVDNARQCDQVIPLLPGSPTCTVLITSRHRLAGLATTHSAQLVDLDVLSETEARQLLVRHLGADRLTAEPDAVADLLTTCAGLPLALAVIAARAAQHPDFPLAVLAKDLDDTSARLDALDTGDLHASLRAALSWSYGALEGQVATGFALLGLAPGPDIGLPAAAVLAGLPAEQTKAVLRTLENASLLQQHAPGRYRMHDLTRLYATEQAHGQLPEATSAPALRRLIDFYLHTAHAADELLHQFRFPIQFGPPPAGCVPLTLADADAARAWLAGEHAGLLAAQQLAAHRGWHGAAVRFALAMNTFHERRGLDLDGIACWRVALRAADREGDPATMAVARERLGRACARGARPAEGLAHLRQGLALAEEIGHLELQILCQAGLGLAWEVLGDDARALAHNEQMLRLARTLGDPLREAAALSSLGWNLGQLGRYAEARPLCERALALSRQLNNANVEYAVLDTFGHFALRTGRYAEALDYYGQALHGFRALGSSYTEADIQASLGTAYAALGQVPEARTAWHQALALYQQQHRVAEAEQVRAELAAVAAESLE